MFVEVPSSPHRQVYSVLGQVLEDQRESSPQGEEHTCDELAVLSVEFPPWYFSTHGLSRPATPVSDDVSR